MQHVQDETDTLPESNEADHGGQHDRKQANDLVEDTGDHTAGDNGAEGSGSSLSVLQDTSLLRVMNIGQCPGCG